MKSRKNILLVLSSGGMMLSTFYAVTSFILASLSQRPVPASEAAVIILSASIITYIHYRRGWRRIYVTGLHLVGYLFSALRLYHTYYRLESPFWSLGWVPEFFMLERTLTGWLGLVVIFMCGWILWFCGIRLWVKPTDQTTLSNRFDLGLAFFLVLVLIKFLIAVKGASISMEHSSVKSLFSFIILGLFSMGLVRTGSASQTGGITYLKGAGVVLSFTAIILILGSGLFFLFSPGLQTLAQAGSDLLGTWAMPFERLVVFFLKAGFLRQSAFSKTGFRRQSGEGPTDDALLTIINRSGGEPGIFHYLFFGIIMAILLATAGFILYHLLKWLFSKTVAEKEKKGLWERLLMHIDSAKRLLSTLWIKFFKTPDSSYAAEEFYKRLLRWGRFSGLHHAVTETPKEYGIRMGHRFPRIENEIGLIIHMHAEAVYGCILPDGHQISRAKTALRRIRHPLLWFTRLKSLCFHNRF